MEKTLILFYLFCAIILLPAGLILFTKNIIHSVYLLVFSFLGIAGIYVIARAEFVAVTQIIIYAGGILILLIFGIMLTNRIEGNKVFTGSGNRLPGAVLGILFFLILTKSILQVSFPSMDPDRSMLPAGISGTQSIGIQLMTEYVLAFETAGFILLVALIGASFLANKNFGKPQHDTD